MEDCCKKSDGRKWRCRQPAMEGHGYCTTHHLQYLHRLKHEPVPQNLKLSGTRSNNFVPKLEELEGVSDLPRRRGRKRKNPSDAVNEAGVSVIPPIKRGRRTMIKEDASETPDQLPGGRNSGFGSGNLQFYAVKQEYKDSVVKDLKFGRMEIPQRSPMSPQLRSVKKEASSSMMKVPVLSATKAPRRTRSINSISDSIATMQVSHVRASAKKKVIKKCHWCKYSSYRVFVQCSTCKKNFFCQECIDRRFHCKNAIKRECPVCEGTCECRGCSRGKAKEVKTKELQNYDCDDEKLINNREEEVVETVPEKNIYDGGEEILIDDREEAVAFDRGEEILVDDREEAVADSVPEKNIYECGEENLIDDRQEDAADSVPEKGVVVYNHEKKFDKIQQLHMIRLLLPVMQKMNQEKINELDIEAENKGRRHDQLHYQLEGCSKKLKCSFCRSWVSDLHRSCTSCSYVLCTLCCQDFREGYLHSRLGDLSNKRLVRSKSRKISWRFCIDGYIRCPPKNLGGCGQDLLGLTCFSPLGWTKDLEANADQIVCKYKFKKSFGNFSSPCFQCDGNDGMGSGNLIKNKGLYFKTKQDLIDKNLEHFMKHWGKGQPLVIRDVLPSQQDLNWDFGYLLCKYLERSAESRKETGTGKSKSGSDWCDVQFSRKQIFMGGITHVNVWKELLRFKVMFSSGFFQVHFPDHYAAVMGSLPVEEYITGFLNLATNPTNETENLNLGPRVCISYGEPNLTDADLITKLCCHAYDVVNILAHATDRTISEDKLNKVKILMNKYSSQHHIKSSRKIRTRNKLEKLFEGSSGVEDKNNKVDLSSDDSSSEDSDDDDDDEGSVYSQHEIGSCSRDAEEQDHDTRGAEWDIFRQEDVPKLVEYLRKYSDKLSKSCRSPKKVVHPLFDEVFYLDELHKFKLKEEFNVEPWSFEQSIGEAVIIPAGCPYQMKKIKSCVNVVLNFISPESASKCIKVGDEIRRLPVNHKAKGTMLKVKNMVINGLHAAIEEMRTVSDVHER